MISVPEIAHKFAPTENGIEPGTSRRIATYDRDRRLCKFNFARVSTTSTASAIMAWLIDKENIYTYPRCMCRALTSPASPLTSDKNAGHSGHLSQAMTHNVQLHVGEPDYRAFAAPERKRRSCWRCGTCGGRVSVCMGNRRHARQTETALENLVRAGLGF